MKKAIFTLALIFTAMVSYGQNKEVYVSPEVDKLVSVNDKGTVYFSFQNRKYKYVQDLESCVLGSVSQTITILETALKGLNDNVKDEQTFSGYDISDFGLKAGIVVTVGDKYTILEPKEIQTIINNLRS